MKYSFNRKPYTDWVIVIMDIDKQEEKTVESGYEFSEFVFNYVQLHLCTHQ